jgi:hypothetical protein
MHILEDTPDRYRAVPFYADPTLNNAVLAHPFGVFPRQVERLLNALAL